MSELSKHLRYFTCLALIFYAANVENFANSVTQHNASEELKSLQSMMDSDEYDKVLTRSQSILLNAGQKNDLYLIASYYAGIASYQKKTISSHLDIYLTINQMKESAYLMSWQIYTGG